MDDGEESFEAFIANRRLCRNNNNDNRKDEEINTKTPKQPVKTCTETFITHEERTGTSTAATDDWNRVNARARARAEDSSDQGYHTHELGDIGDVPSSHWFDQSPVRQAPDLNDSSLFVQQDNNVASTSSSSRATTTCESTSSFFRSRPKLAQLMSPGVHLLRQPCPEQPPHNQAQRVIAMRDVFSEDRFVDAIKHNPYTSGIFAYQGVSKEQTLGVTQVQAKHHIPGEREEDDVDPYSGKVLGKEKKQQSKPLAGVEKSQIFPPQLSTKPQQIDNDAEITIDENSNILSEAHTERVSAGACSPKEQYHSTGVLEDPQPISMQQQPAQTFNYTQLVASLDQKVRKYESVLTRLDCKYVRGSKDWQILESQIQPDIDQLTQMLHCSQNIDVETFEKILEAWDLDLGVRVLLQKHITYSSLLRSAQRLQNNCSEYETWQE